MTGLLGTPYTVNQASYDLARLARNGLIARVPNCNQYELTPDGLRFAVSVSRGSSGGSESVTPRDHPRNRPRPPPRPPPAAQP
jgi:hypothetical protein